MEFCLQARILEWVAIPFSGRSSRTRDRTQVYHIAGKFLTIWAAREAKHTPNPTPQIPERSKSHFLLREDRATSESQHWPKPSRMRVAGGQPTGADGSWGGEASWLPPRLLHTPLMNFKFLGQTFHHQHEVSGKYTQEGSKSSFCKAFAPSLTLPWHRRGRDQEAKRQNIVKKKKKKNLFAK